MRAVALGEKRQARAVEVDAAIVDVIRVLIGVNAAGAEPDLAVLLVHAVHAAHHPFAPRDLVLHLPGLRIVEVEVVPAVALRHPEDLVGRVEVAVELLAAVVDERLALLVDDGAGAAGLGIHRDDAQDLVAALVVEEREPARIRRPAIFLNAPGIGKQLVADRDFLLLAHVEQMRLGDGNLSPGLR